MFQSAPSEVFEPKPIVSEGSQDFYFETQQILSIEEDVTTETKISVKLADFGACMYK